MNWQEGDAKTLKIALYTLGCKVNQYETQAMEQELQKRGHSLVPFDEWADAYIINTCTVTAVSDKKSRNAIRRAKKLNPDAVVGVCGCYAQVASDELEQLQIDVLSGSGDRMGFLDLIEREFEERCPVVAVDDVMARRTFERLPAGGLSVRTRAMLKIEDGCTNFCSYCIIPYARGRVRSLPMEDALSEVNRLKEDGYREIVLTGIEISSWGRDLAGEQTLTDLIEQVCRAVPEMRIRLGSLEPRTVTEDFCVRLAALPNLCPQFHLSLQSGCDTTLKRMNRKYDNARYFESVTLLRRYFNHPAITTDLIAAFPEETEEEFLQTLAFIERCAFAEMHVFPYSIRPGTPAAQRKQIEKYVKEERAHRAANVARKMHEAYLDSCIGAVYPVLFEQEKNGVSTGHAPNYMEVCVKEKGLHNQVKNVRITHRNGSVLQGELA